jgi:hypothetical protein
MSRCTTCVLCAVACVFALYATPSSAGYLAGDASAYSGWHGSTPFNDGADLFGYVDWAVYAPGSWPASFDFGTFTPDTGNLLYTYQVFSEGTDPVTLTLVTLNGEAYDDGWFTGTGVSSSVDGEAPTGHAIIPFTSVFWNFDGLVLESSKGLFFTSPNVPEEGAALFQDGGSSAVGFPVPSPSPFNIPEPTSLMLALSGLVGFAAVLRRKRAGRTSV